MMKNCQRSTNWKEGQKQPNWARDHHFVCKKISDGCGRVIAVSEEICKRCENNEGVWKHILKIEQTRKRTPPKPPSMEQMIRSFTIAMVRWAIKGFKTVDRNKYIKRRQICAACQPGSRCPVCGCHLWAKAALTTEQCPEGKWPK